MLINFNLIYTQCGEDKMQNGIWNGMWNDIWKDNILCEPRKLGFENFSRSFDLP